MRKSLVLPILINKNMHILELNNLVLIPLIIQIILLSPSPKFMDGIGMVKPVNPVHTLIVLVPNIDYVINVSMDIPKLMDQLN